MITEFGTDVLGPDGRINRTKISRVVFHDEDHQIKQCNYTPLCLFEIDKKFDKVLVEGKFNIFVVDAALIYESGADTHMDYVVVVASRLGLRIERALSKEI